MVEKEKSAKIGTNEQIDPAEFMTNCVMLASITACYRHIERILDLDEDACGGFNSAVFAFIRSKPDVDRQLKEIIMRAKGDEDFGKRMSALVDYFESALLNAEMDSTMVVDIIGTENLFPTGKRDESEEFEGYV